MGFITQMEQHWLDQGIEQGIERGRVEGKKLLACQLEQKFKTIPERYRQKLQSADTEALLCWGLRFVDANTLEEIFVEE